MELGFRIPIVSGIPDSLSCIPDSKTQDPPFHEQKCARIPDSKFDLFITWGESRACKPVTALHTFVLCPYFSLFQVSVLAPGDRKEIPNPLRLASVGTNTKHLMNDSQKNRLN